MAIEKQKLILIGGLVLGVVAVFMVKMTIDQQKLAAQEQAKKTIAKMQANQTSVLVAKQDIPKGSTIEANMLDASIVPNKFIQPRAATSLDRISGMISIAPISKGEQISLSKLSSTQKLSGGNLAAATPAGKRAISIPVDNVTSVSGMVRPGDYVDVIATLQVPVQDPEGQMSKQMAVVPLFQNVLILAVGQNTGFASSEEEGRYAGKKETSSGPALITLALGPQEVNLIAFVQEQGKMRLTLRSPADAKVEPVIPASWETLFQHIAPPRTAENKAAPVDTNEYVEVYRGLNKEKVPLIK